MTLRYASFLLLGLSLLLRVQPARAQYLFKDAAGTGTNGLGPYTQNFNSLYNTNAIFTSNTTLTGVYARFTLNNVPGEFESSARATGAQAKLGPDDGSEGPQTVSSVDADGTPHGAAWYHFGLPNDPDRALGGIASTTTTTGQGYVGIRLKNSSSKVIKNLEISYAMEQWFNSSNTQAANVTVDYQRSTSPITSMVTPNANASWISIPTLGVFAPSTSTAIAPRNGNAPTNRRVLQTTLTGLNLAVNEEIMIRFGYTFNSSSNGNGLSIDDVVITPETNIYYSSAATSSNLDNVNNWGANTDGTGAKPANFTTPNTVYYVRGNNSGVDRINGNWTVSGANSKIVVGPTTGEPATLYVNANDFIVGTVDVNAGSTLQINQANNNIALGALHTSSTVEYINANTTAQNVKGASYGTLKLSGTGPRSLTGFAQVNTALAFNATSTAFSLNDFDLLLLKGTQLTGLNGGNTLFVTNGKGSLRRTVTNDNVPVLFPVGTTASSYTPATLSQSVAQSEDSYAVRVAENTYSRYDAANLGIGAAIAYKNVKKTWVVAEEVEGNSSITLALQWNAADATTSFTAADAHINRYAGGAWDRFTSAQGTTTVSTGVFSQKRAGLTSFSPFAISSRADGALPVELLAFAARSTTAGVTCTWATASEKNSSFFAIERSLNGQEFSAVGRVEAAGNSVQRLDYQFADTQAPTAKVYYRLRQVDTDGTEAFSPVVAVEAGLAAAPASLSVVPNPGTGHFEVWATEGTAASCQGEVLNALGVPLLKLQADNFSSGTCRFDLSSQPAGVYLLRMQMPQGTRTVRVVKQ